MIPCYAQWLASKNIYYFDSICVNACYILVIASLRAQESSITNASPIQLCEQAVRFLVCAKRNYFFMLLVHIFAMYCKKCINESNSECKNVIILSLEN